MIGRLIQVNANKGILEWKGLLSNSNGKCKNNKHFKRVYTYKVNGFNKPQPAVVSIGK